MTRTYIVYFHPREQNCEKAISFAGEHFVIYIFNLINILIFIIRLFKYKIHCNSFIIVITFDQIDPRQTAWDH